MRPWTEGCIERLPGARSSRRSAPPTRRFLLEGPEALAPDSSGRLEAGFEACLLVLMDRTPFNASSGTCFFVGFYGSGGTV